MKTVLKIFCGGLLMKKTLLILLVICMFLLSGCICMLLLSGCGSGVFQVFQKPKTSKGSSPDNLVPLGEYVDICPDERDVQVCISEIITGDKAKEIVGSAYESLDFVIIKFNMKAVNLNGEEFRPSSMNMILNDGTIERDTYIHDAEKNLGLSVFGMKTFGAEGSSDQISLFSVKLDQCKYLRYGDRAYDDDVTYFAIRE